jgi:hypothetical protein
LFAVLYVCVRYRSIKKNTAKVHVASVSDVDDDLEKLIKLNSTEKPKSSSLEQNELETPVHSPKKKLIRPIYKYAVHPMNIEEKFDLYEDMKLKIQYHPSSSMTLSFEEHKSSN